jgi:hypothetical protein
MDDIPRTPSRTAVGAAVAAGVLEGLARDAMVTGAVLFSLITLVAGLTSEDLVVLALGLSTGLVGMVLPVVAVGRRWSVGRTWLVLIGILLADVAMMTLIWTR